jgi:glycerol-3-phosphate dehydrogenase
MQDLERVAVIGAGRLGTTLAAVFRTSGPRDEDRDAALAAECGADILLAPDVETVSALGDAPSDSGARPPNS